MNACLVMLGLALGCSGSTGGQAPEDSWVAEDKLRHFALSFAVTALAYGGARTALDRPAARAAAGGAALAAGLGKEIVDVRRGGAFGVRDLVWDLAGVAAGLTLANQTR